MEQTYVIPAAAGGSLGFIYVYLVIAAAIAAYLVAKSRTSYWFELLVITYLLLIGDYSNFLTFKIPGLSSFEIQPGRFVFLAFGFFWVRQLLSGKLKTYPGKATSTPNFMIVLYLFVASVTISQLYHLEKLGFSEVVVQTVYGLTFVVIVETIRVIADEAFFRVIGQAMIIGAVFSSLICLAQLGYESSFMRIGDSRAAFGAVIRCNGMFSAEYTNSYFLITAMYWTLVTWNGKVMKVVLLGLFALGVFSTFHRMSWLILTLTLGIYFLKIRQSSMDQLALVVLVGLAVLLSGTLLFYRDVLHSSLVQERLTDSVEGRQGYWTMVANHIGEKPVFGFGDKHNEVYYTNMLRVTRDRNRATGVTGDIHNGYLQAMFIYGIPTFFFFTGFVILSVFYFGKMLRYHPFFAIPFLFSILYMMANLTNNFLFNKSLALICAIQLGIGLGVHRLLAPSSAKSTP